jgi:hypothetical protein
MAQRAQRQKAMVRLKQRRRDHSAGSAIFRSIRAARRAGPNAAIRVVTASSATAAAITGESAPALIWTLDPPPLHQPALFELVERGVERGEVERQPAAGSLVDQLDPCSARL